MKLLVRKLLFMLIPCSIILAGGLCFGSNNFYYEYNSGGQSDINTNIGHMIRTDTVENTENSFQRLLRLFKLSEQDWYNSGTSKAIYYIKMIINLLLSLTAFVSLIMIIFAFYMIFFSKDDSGVTKAKQVLKGIILALVIMGLSWFIVSILFWVEKGATTQSNVTYNTPQSIENQNFYL